MPNMSYVRFENTYRDLKDCAENMHDVQGLSESEQKWRIKLIELCEQIADEYREGADEE